MFKLLILTYTVILACEANIQVPPPVLCGFMPESLTKCLHDPKIVKSEVVSKCNADVSECERLGCIFEKSGWIKDAKINKEVMREYFDNYVKDNPEWAPAVQDAKTACLTTDLLPQGTYLNCPAYDVVTCTLSSFVKNAQPSQWQSSEQCRRARQFAAACPLCPTSCFASQIPIGSCNACIALPRSP